MKTHCSLTDDQFLHQLQMATLDVAFFNHEAHLRLAWIQLKRHDNKNAISKTCTLIQNYVQVLGAMDKFNKTLTVAAVEAVAHFMQKTEVRSFEVFIEANPQLTLNFKGLLQTHYSFDIFSSTSAKSDYLAPDLVLFE